ncbi:MAG TPA: DnaJ domain-containing protein [Pyrinomonadaceae bacterium]|nr:DnaJ domain-containing protein [Pyrinomonadaceae bacterium]
MPIEQTEDYYEVLQVSANADHETIDRVYRLLAQRFHPDNQQTGNENRFRTLLEAYTVLRDPEKRARYDVLHQQHRQDRWRLVASGAQTENDFEMEQVVRLTVLEALYTQRRLEPTKPGIFWGEFEKLTGRPREHLEFTLWFLVQKKLVQRGDDSRLMLTVDGVEYLEQSYRANLQQKRLQAANE